MLALIWAQDENGMIGQSQGHEGMPWKLPNDLKHFSKITKQGDIVMGRTTYDLITHAPLPDRKNLVLTSNKEYEAPGAFVVHSVEDVLDFASSSKKPLFIAGGASLYEQFIPHADCIYRTVIHESFEGDTYIPDVDWTEWELKESISGQMDDNNVHRHTFELYQRKKGD